MTADVGGDEWAECGDGEVLRARVLESGMRQYIGDAPVSEGRWNLGVYKDDFPWSASVLEHRARSVQPGVKLVRSFVVFDDGVVDMWSRHRP